MREMVVDEALVAFATAFHQLDRSEHEFQREGWNKKVTLSATNMQQQTHIELSSTPMAVLLQLPSTLCLSSQHLCSAS
jgi:ABC-type iron transport system FetAB permease component